MSENGLRANKKFTAEYTFDGIKWGVDVWASTHEEAEMKLKAMGKGKVFGLVAAEIPAGGWCPTCGREQDGAL